MNGDAGVVLSSPVKRLLGVRFTGPVTVASERNTRSYARSAGVRDIPNYVSPRLQSLFLGKSPTGRLCDEDIDVIHFTISVLVDNRFVFPFMKELCSEHSHSFVKEVYGDPSQGSYFKSVKSAQPVQSRHNQITILQTDFKAVDKADPAHEFYRYGKGAVMQLDLICEYQFSRQGYDMIKPKAIKKRLSQSEEDAEQGNAADGMMFGM